MRPTVVPLVVSAVFLAFLPLLVSPALAQKKKAPAAKPPVTGTAGQPYVLGTKQLPGDFGKFGQEYTVGVNDPLNIVVKKAAFLVDRLYVETVGDGKITWFPPAGKKYLRVDVTVKNGNPKQVDAPAFIKATTVDASDENKEVLFLLNAKSGKQLTQPLKPGQAVEAFLLFEVPADVDVPKLIIQREDGAAVVRYDLKGKIAPLPKWAGGGISAPDTIVGIRDCVHPAQYFDIGLRGLENKNAGPDGAAPEDGEGFIVAHLQVIGATGGITLNGSALGITLKTSDSAEVLPEGAMILDSTKSPYDASPLRGETAKVSVFFRVKKGAMPQLLRIKDTGLAVSSASQRTIDFDVSGQDWFTIRDCFRDVRTGQAIAPIPKQ